MEEHTHEGDTLPCGCQVRHNNHFGRKRGLKTFLLVLVIEIGLIVVLLALGVGLAFSRGGGGGDQVRWVPIVSPYNGNYGSPLPSGQAGGGAAVPPTTSRGSSPSGTGAGTPTGTSTNP